MTRSVGPEAVRGKEDERGETVERFVEFESTQSAPPQPAEARMGF